jgi:hypothetical protein
MPLPPLLRTDETRSIAARSAIFEFVVDRVVVA